MRTPPVGWKPTLTKILISQIMNHASTGIFIGQEYQRATATGLILKADTPPFIMATQYIQKENNN